MIAIFNVVLVVGGAFAFGYKAVEYSLEKPDMVKVCSNLYYLFFCLFCSTCDL